MELDNSVLIATGILSAVCLIVIWKMSSIGGNMPMQYKIILSILIIPIIYFIARGKLQ